MSKGSSVLLAIVMAIGGFMLGHVVGSRSGTGTEAATEEVQAADVVCVIESMKIFTELRADQAGTVKQVLVENEEPVMKNQELIEIEIA